MNPRRDNPKIYPLWYQVKEKDTGKYLCSFSAKNIHHAKTRLKSLRGQALRQTEIIAGYDPKQTCNAR